MQIHGIINDLTVTILIDDKLLKFVSARQIIVELVDLLVDDLNLLKVNILLQRNDILQVKQVLQFMNSIFVCQLIPDVLQMTINSERFDPYEWIGLSCEL